MTEARVALLPEGQRSRESRGCTRVGDALALLGSAGNKTLTMLGGQCLGHKTLTLVTSPDSDTSPHSILGGQCPHRPSDLAQLGGQSITQGTTSFTRRCLKSPLFSKIHSYYCGLRKGLIIGSLSFPLLQPKQRGGSDLGEVGGTSLAKKRGCGRQGHPPSRCGPPTIYLPPSLPPLPRPRPRTPPLLSLRTSASLSPDAHSLSFAPPS